MKAVGDYRQARSREAYEIARFQAVLIVNPTLGKRQIKKVEDYVRFAWEEKKVGEKQSVEEMKSVLFSIAAGAKRRETIKQREAPPVRLATKQRK